MTWSSARFTAGAFVSKDYNKLIRLRFAKKEKGRRLRTYFDRPKTTPLDNQHTAPCNRANERRATNYVGNPPQPAQQRNTNTTQQYSWEDVLVTRSLLSTLETDVKKK